MPDAPSAFESLDELPLERFHVLAMLTTGMGVFTDGYDLSSIGLVLPLVLASFGIDHISGLQSGLLTGSALVGSAIGAVVFGLLAQRGRKRFYGVDVALMAVAALAQAFAPNLWSLIVIRFFLGVGVGADYVLSPTIMAEHANRRDRGKTIGLGFGVMWCVGAFVAGVLLLVLRAAGVPAAWQWRIVLAAGTFPALSVLTLRRRMPETARFLARLGGRAEDAEKVIAGITGTEGGRLPLADRRAWHTVLHQHARAVFGAAALWLVYDVVIYSGVLFGPSVIAHGLGTTPDHFTLVVYGLFTIPGAIVGSLVIDRLGRRALMALGFVFGGVALFAFAPHLGAGGAVMVGLGFYGAYTFTMSAGPGTVSGSGILGVELAPTRIRSVAQGITVVGGRTGAAIAAFVFPALLGVIGARHLMMVLGAVAIVGAVLTFVLVPETAGRSLEELGGDTDAAIAALE
jgi:MFS family permease